MGNLLSPHGMIAHPPASINSVSIHVSIFNNREGVTTLI